MKKIIYIILLFFSLISFGQTPIHKIVFYDSIGKETQSNNYHSKRVIKEFNLEKPTYEVEYYVKIDGKVILESKFFVNDKIKLYLEGEQTNYYASGNIKEIRNFNNGNLFGITKRWHENGKLYFEGEYKLHNDKSTLFHLNYWDKNGVQKLINGNGTLEEFSGFNDEIIFSGEIKNGLKDGFWKTNQNKFPRQEELYKNGNLIKGTIYKSETNIRNYNTFEVDAKPIGGVDEFRIKLAKNIQKIKSSISFKGRAVIRFTINENGELINFKNIDGIDEESFNKMVEIIKNTAKWESAIMNGREVKAHRSLPITIQ